MLTCATGEATNTRGDPQRGRGAGQTCQIGSSASWASESATRPT